MTCTVFKNVGVAALGLLLCSCAHHGGGAGATDPVGGRIAQAYAPEDPAPGDTGEHRRAGPGRTPSEAVPTAAEIFDFHPPGSRPGAWRAPFVVSYTEGPLNAYRLRTLAELRLLQDHRYDLVPSSAVAAR